MESQTMTSCICSTTKSFSDLRIRGRLGLELLAVFVPLLGDRGGGTFLCSRISSHLSSRSRYVGWRAAKNSIGAYPSRMYAETFDVTANWNVRRNLSSEDPFLLRLTTGDG